MGRKQQKLKGKGKAAVKEKHRSSKNSSKKKMSNQNLKQIGEKVRQEVDSINADFRTLHGEMISCQKTASDDKPPSPTRTDELQGALEIAADRGDRTVKEKKKLPSPVTNEEIEDFTEKLVGL